MTEISLIVTLHKNFTPNDTLGIRRTYSRLKPPGVLTGTFFLSEKVMCNIVNNTHYILVICDIVNNAHYIFDINDILTEYIFVSEMAESVL